MMGWAQPLELAMELFTGGISCVTAISMYAGHILNEYTET